MDKIDLKNIQIDEQTDPKKLIEIINALHGQTVKIENKPIETKDINKPKRPYFKPKGKTPMYKSRIRTKAKISRVEMIHYPQLQYFLFEKRGNSFVFRYRKRGLDKQFSNVNYEVARDKALDWLVGVRPADFYSAKEVFDYSPTVLFEDLGDEWFYYLKRPRVKEITYKGYIALYDKEIRPYFGKYKMIEIIPKMLQQFLDSFKEKTPRKTEALRSMLNEFFNFAVDMAVIKNNPMKIVYLEPYQRKNGVALLPDEEKKFVQDIKGTKYEFVFLKFLYSGVRSGEFVGMTENIEDNTLTIKNGKLKAWQKNLFRTIPMSPMYQKTLSTINTHDLIDMGDANRELKKYLPEHSLKDLRHTFTTRARECGVDNELVAIWTGHSLSNITSSVYTHFSMEFQQEQVNKIDY